MELGQQKEEKVIIKKIKLPIKNIETNIILNALIQFKNDKLKQGIYTEPIDELILKLSIEILILYTKIKKVISKIKKYPWYIIKLYYKIVILSNIRMTTYMIKNDNIIAINYFLVKKGLALYEIS